MPSVSTPPQPPETFFQRWKTMILLGGLLIVLLLLISFYFLVKQQAIEHSLLSSAAQSSQLSVDANASGEQDSDSFSAVYNFVDDPSIGPEDAVLTIVAFEDFGCPFCQSQQLALKQALTEYEGSVRFVYRDFPITALHPQAQLAAEAAQCAHAQGKFWEYHDTLFANQSRHTEEDLKRYAQTLGLDTIQFDRCIESGTYTQEVLDDYQDGLRAGVRGTPTFFFNGEKLAGVITLEGFREIIGYFNK